MFIPTKQQTMTITTISFNQLTNKSYRLTHAHPNYDNILLQTFISFIILVNEKSRHSEVTTNFSIEHKSFLLDEDTHGTLIYWNVRKLYNLYKVMAEYYSCNIIMIPTHACSIRMIVNTLGSLLHTM